MVVDELIVILGLDTSKFTEGQRDALAAFKKTKEGATEFGKDVERQGMKLSELFGIVRKGALGIVGAFAGGEAAAFINHVITMDAATGRMARTIGTSVTNLGVWQSMIRQIGGSAAEASSALSTLQQTINDVRQGGGMFEGGFASLMNQAGVSIRDDADTSLRKIQQFISGQVGSGKMRPEEAATFLRRVPGMNESMINLLLSDFKKIEEAAKNVGGATDKSAEAAQKLQSRFDLMVQAMERFGASLLPIVDLLMKPTGQITKDDVWNTFGLGADAHFTPGSAMDKLDHFLWGDWKAKKAAGGGTRGDRNNNPGNMEYGAFARAHGATGSDGRFAIFPDRETGAAAQAALVGGPGYAGLTLEQFARKYAEGAPAWQATVGAGLGIGPHDIVNNKDPRLLDAIRRAEGTGAKAGAAARSINNSRSSSSSSSNEVNIGKVEVHAPNATDAGGIASEIGGALKRTSMISGVNSGLV